MSLVPAVVDANTNAVVAQTEIFFSRMLPVETTPEEASEKMGFVGSGGKAVEDMSGEELEQELAKVCAKLKEIEDEQGDP